MVVGWVLVVLVVDELGIDSQIADQGMAFSELQRALLVLFADEPLDVFEPAGTAFKRLAACRIE
jgi:hypothetical protein